MLTTGSNIFTCTLALAREVAEEWFGLRQVCTADRSELDVGIYPELHSYYRWEDRQTAGGGCRITWKDGIAWVSRHAGYPQADVTDDACEILKMLGAKDCPGHKPVPGSFGA